MADEDGDPIGETPLVGPFDGVAVGEPFGLGVGDADGFDVVRGAGAAVFVGVVV